MTTIDDVTNATNGQVIWIGGTPRQRQRRCCIVSHRNQSSQFGVVFQRQQQQIVRIDWWQICITVNLQFFQVINACAQTHLKLIFAYRILCQMLQRPERDFKFMFRCNWGGLFNQDVFVDLSDFHPSDCVK